MNYTLLILISLLLISCNRDDHPIGPEYPDDTSTVPIDTLLPKVATINTDFESGSIGEVNHISDIMWELSLRDDNSNSSLKESWRTWWYVRMDSLNTDTTTTIRLKNRGWSYYYTPIYSYDQKEWFRFERDEISQPSSYELLISKEFEQSSVWIARTFPYTFSDLKQYISSIEGAPHLSITTPGITQNGNPLYLFRIENPISPDSLKQNIAIHARTHPAETGPSFMLEGLIDFLTSGSDEAEEILSRNSFSIFPMHNVDGVIAGNYRTTPNSENLEIMWFRDSTNATELTESIVPEIETIYNHYKSLGSSVSVALNLHSSNTPPERKPFFFPHFGTVEQGFDSTEAALWQKSRRFIDNLAFHYGMDNLDTPPSKGSTGFVTNSFPESWWWANFKDTVMAITMELPYENGGPGGEMVTPDHFREVGKAVALAIGDYTAGITPEIIWPGSSRSDTDMYTEEISKE